MSVTRLAELLESRRPCVVLTGAGISTESGIPDFRSAGGIWAKYDPAEVAHIDAFRRDPARVWEFYALRLDGLAQAEPNDGHRALAELEGQGWVRAVVTQNVDGLHQRAGSSPERIVEIHGTMHEVVCMECGERAPMERALARVRAGEADPSCRSCGGILKSATISFGQNLVPEDLRRAEQAALRADLLLAIGSTLAVYPAAGVVPTAKRAGARVVILNAEATKMDDLADAVLRGSISAILPRLVDPRPEG